MERKNILVGLAALLVFGALLVTSLGTQEEEGCPFAGKEFRGKCNGEESCPFAGKDLRGKGELAGEGKAAMLEKLGLGEDATREEVREAMFQEKLDKMGLTEDSTIREMKDAMYGHRLSMMREKLGLSEDATEEEMKDALGERAFNGHKGFGKKMGWGM